MRRTVLCGSPLLSFAISVLFTLLFTMISLTTAAPIPRTGPLTIEGTVEDVRWYPEAVHGGMPGMSGTLAQGRTFPARYQVVLKNISISEASGGYGLSVDRESGKAMLLLNHPSDDRSIGTVMRIRVSGLRRMGGRGGQLE